MKNPIHSILPSPKDIVWPLLLFCSLFAVPADLCGQSSRTNQLAEVKTAKLGSTKNVHQCGNLFTAGQFSEQDIAKIKAAGVSKVISLRLKREVKWDEKRALQNANISFQQFPFYYASSLNDEIFDQVRKSLADSKTKTLIHCGAASRVAAVWLPYRVLDQGQELKTALKEAKTIGYLSEGYQKKAIDYIQRKQAERSKSSSPAKGINKSFLDPNMDVKKYTKMFEIESREIYSSRYEILKACKISEDAVIADVGAGTGLFTRLFSVQAKKGWVYAIDIAPRFLEHIRKDATKHQLKNISPVLCNEDSINLPPNSVDVVFICDTYHHFEYHQKTMKSIHTALRKDGVIVLIDFERIPGVTRNWILNHVRAGKDQFRNEIEKAGFRFIEEIKVPGMKENYFLRFKKKSK